MKSVNDPEVLRGLRELQDLISQRYPEAQFFVGGEDELVLNVLVDIDDYQDVLDTSVLDLLYELQVERDLPIGLVSSWPAQRALDESAKSQQPSLSGR